MRDLSRNPPVSDLLPESVWTKKEENVGPRNPTEEILVEIWSSLLHLEQPGIFDNFFEIGEYSLLVTQVTSRIQNTFQVDFPVRFLFETPVLADLATKLDLILQEDHTLSIPPVTRISRDRDLSVSFAQQRLWFLHQLEPENTAFNIPLFCR